MRRSRDSAGRCAGPPRRGAVPPRVCPASDPPSGLRSASCQPGSTARLSASLSGCGDTGIRGGTSGSCRASLSPGLRAEGLQVARGGFGVLSLSPFCRLAKHGAALLPLQSFPRAAQREERRSPTAAGAKLAAKGGLLPPVSSLLSQRKAEEKR